MPEHYIQLKLFASLSNMAPENANRLPIKPGASVHDLLEQLGIPVAKAHLIFVDGVKQSLDACLQGGERVGIFPPVAGG
ncbi:ThiamineS protein [Desulfosarcina cetonica]|uniref:MoaD/ThiS family protein n=1 Tax=Desulfosarcina cetonica TaxID=90730 RepID=UPI0006CF2C87|nr:MoaD/ThiS family protein [Desulfosarcina cetonica]VTR65554.1 ThiamineS protein [Desulfosarcina cetonica]